LEFYVEFVVPEEFNLALNVGENVV